VFRAPIHAGFAIFIAIIASVAVTTGCAHHTSAKIPPSAARPVKIGSTETGIASWYGNPYHGRRAASGEIYDMEQLTAAHRSLPFQTWVEVTDLDNGKKVTVRITDRGPFVDGRIIDLSLAAARAIEMVGPGIAHVKLKVVTAPQNMPDRIEVAKSQTSSPPISPPVSQPISPSLSPPVLPKRDPVRPAAPIRELYTVQAAVFADRDHAEAYSSTLRTQFADLVNESRVISSPAGWKVLLGRELTLDIANDLAARVKEVGGTAVVVRDSF